jgi:hypothetical protein
MSFTVTRPGTVVVTASLELNLGHTTGQSTIYTVSLANASAGCSPVSNHFVTGLVSTAQPTGNYYPDMSLVQSFPVGAAGTYTFSIIGTASMSSSSDASVFWYGSVVGVYYPS